jgi:predicted GNAT family acetyltransferase
LSEEFAIIDYRWDKGDIIFMHTFVPQAVKRKGIAGKLAQFALEHVKENNLKMKINCPI